MKVSIGFRSLTLALAGCVIFTSALSAKTDKANGSANAISPTEESGNKEKGLQFSVLGDWGWNGKRNQTEVAKIMVAKRVGSFIISAGDNFQVVGVFLNMAKGTLSFSSGGTYKGIAFKSPLLEKAPLYPAIALYQTSVVSVMGQPEIPAMFLVELA